jgi:hypothetical protein
MYINIAQHTLVSSGISIILSAIVDQKHGREVAGNSRVNAVTIVEADQIAGFVTYRVHSTHRGPFVDTNHFGPNNLGVALADFHSRVEELLSASLPGPQAVLFSDLADGERFEWVDIPTSVDGAGRRFHNPKWLEGSVWVKAGCSHFKIKAGVMIRNLDRSGTACRVHRK